MLHLRRTKRTRLTNKSHVLPRLLKWEAVDLAKLPEGHTQPELQESREKKWLKKRRSSGQENF